MTNQTIPLEAIDFIKPIPVKHLKPLGHLPDTQESCALWQFLICAFQALDKVEKQVTLEGEQDQVVNLRQIAESVLKLYGYEVSTASFENVFNERLVSLAKREARRCDLPWDSRVDAWFRSGGRSYNVMDRDADKTGL